MDLVDQYISQALQTYNISGNNLFFAGMSLAGTRALKYAIYCKKGDSRNHIMPKAIAVCDSPLDMTRFWRDATRYSASLSGLFRVHLLAI